MLEGLRSRLDVGGESQPQEVGRKYRNAGCMRDISIPSTVKTKHSSLKGAARHPHSENLPEYSRRIPFFHFGESSSPAPTRAWAPADQTPRPWSIPKRMEYRRYYDGDVRRTPVPQHDPQIMPLAYGELPGDYDSSYRSSSQPCQDKTAYGSATQEVPRGPVPNYKPAPLKWPFLCMLAAVLLGLIALTEYSCRVLPAESGREILATPKAIKSPPSSLTVARRQDQVGGSITPAVSSII